ncbi:MAG: PAS domain-containing protein [Phycisphaerales bacterium]|nr:PAS domain-containing protein [Phycisphaerales bacterium]
MLAVNDIEAQGVSTHAPAGGQTIREALMHDAGCAVALLDPDGRVLECNGAFAELLRAPSPAALIGVPFYARLDGQGGQALAGAHGVAFSRGQPMAVDGGFGPILARATFRPVQGGESPRVLLVVAPWHPGWAVPPGVMHVETEQSERQAVASLTPREREVLRGIACGLTTAEIARDLHRSTKTVEGHRVSLGIKLGVTNRVQLARIAIRAGLAPLHDRMIEPKGPELAPPGATGGLAQRLA